MKLRLNVTKAQLDKLPEELQKLYTATDADETTFKIEIDGYEDPAELRRAKDRETQNAKDTAKKLKDAEKELAELRESAGNQNQDVKTLDASWKTKFEKMQTTLQGEIDNLRGTTKTEKKTSAAEALANKVSISPELILPYISSRLDVEFDDTGKAALKVLDKDGKISASTLADFEKEILENKSFAPILRASQASGGGATHDGSGGTGGAGKHNSGNPPDLTKMTAKDLAAYIAENKSGA